MARATRSSTQQDQPKPIIESPTKSRKSAPKKRKRPSLSDATELPLAKQPRTDDDDTKGNSSQEPDENPTPNTSDVDRPSSGDVPLHPAIAAKILDILEAVDTQGLLDRVFPLSPQSEQPATPLSVAGPSTGPQSHSHSFHSLLKDPSSHPVRVLRSAVQHLVPISSHPRSRPSPTAAEQLRFCNLTFSLLDQASSHSAPVPLNVDSIISQYTQDSPSASITPSTKLPDTLVHKRKYALVQRLPTGDWWSSASSGIPPDGRDLTELPTAHAELVAIFPSSSFRPSPGHSLTLAEYVKPSPTANFLPHEPRRVTCGRFLDYGPYASFAPTFDQEGKEVGRIGLAETIWYQERKGRQHREELLATSSSSITTSEMEPNLNGLDQTPSSSNIVEEAPDSMEGLLAPDEVNELKSTLGSLELEQAVQELLERNFKALQRLEELQLQRLGSEEDGSKPVEVGSEEWETAQGILDSLTLLASLRPRSSKDDKERAPLAPSVSALRKLHRTLPVESTGGWYGTLPAGRTTALRDDSTIHVKSGVVTSVTATPLTPAVTAPTTPVAKPQTPAATYNYSAYPGYGTGQYRGGYGTYTPGQSGSYYSNYPTTPQTATAAAHYSGTPYNTTGQHQYSYSTSWYSYQPTTTPQTGGTSSGRATPQPIPATTNNYSGGYLAQTSQQPQPQRAVANTVATAAATKGYQQQGTWPNGQMAGTSFVPPTLPSHLRTSGGGGITPGAPASAGGGTYGGYVTTAQFSAAR